MKRIIFLGISLLTSIILYGQPILYGIGSQGGQYSNGNIFKMDVSEPSLSTVYNFGEDEGDYPGFIGQIHGDNGNLYGIVANGDMYGNFNFIYEFDPINNTYEEICKFESRFATIPNTGITFDKNGIIYGTCQYTGEYYKGSVFRYDMQNDEFTEVHLFQGNPDGDRPMGGLLCANDSMLYGVTNSGGVSQGSIFRIDPNNSEYEHLASFSINNGRYPESSLAQGPDELLYGVTSKGGDDGKGVIYNFNPGTSEITKLHDFDGVKGEHPSGKLLYSSDGNFYGFTKKGGIYNQGVLFHFNIYTNIFEKVYDFKDSISGSTPISSLVLAGDGNIYGLTSYGGANGGGCLFEYNLSTKQLCDQYHFGHNAHNGSIMVDQAGNIFGTTYKFIFDFDIITKQYTQRLRFGSCVEGRLPLYCLAEALNGKMYGTSIKGGQFDNGVLFEVDPVTNSYTAIIDFVQKNLDYYNTIEMQLTPEGKMLGVNTKGGENYWGFFYLFDPDTYQYEIVAEFDSDNTGSYPTGLPVLATDGYYYGRTAGGGVNHSGGIYRFSLESFTVEMLHNFPSTLGSDFDNLLLAENGNLYGIIRHWTCGGPNPMNLFSYNPGLNQYQEIYEFEEGKDPGNIFLAKNGKIYSFTTLGGDYDQGIIHEFDIETLQYSIKHHFEFSLPEFHIRGSLMQASNEKIYGIASNGFSAIFEYDLTTNECNELTTFWFAGDNTFQFMELKDLIGINEPNIEHFNIYPNPFNDYISIKSTNRLPTEYRILDIKGSEIQNGSLSGSTIEIINLENLESGMFFIEIKGEDYHSIQKIIKIR